MPVTRALVSITGMLLVAGCAASPAPAPAPAPPASTSSPAASNDPSLVEGPSGPCARDDECAVTRSIGCCSCPEAPFGLLKRELGAHQDDCAVVECARPAHDCAPVPALEGFRAACQHSVCVAAPVTGQ